MFDKATLRGFLGEMVCGQQVQLSDIPDINLYMEQVEVFFERKLSHLKRSERDKLLTKTMINNYTKAGLLMPPRKKRYSRQHIAILMLVYGLKQVLAITDIASLFRPFLKSRNQPGPQNEARSNEIIDQLYTMSMKTVATDIKQLSLLCDQQVEQIEKQCAELDIPEEERENIEWFLMVMFLSSQAAFQKRLAEMIIDRHFCE